MLSGGGPLSAVLGLGFHLLWGLGLRGLGFRGLGFIGLGFSSVGYRGFGFKGWAYRASRGFATGSKGVRAGS